MLFREAIVAAKLNTKLQVFASDVDADAVTHARDGFYPEAIEADVSPARLERFFSREDHGYRVSDELRAAVVFTVQDVLADPPFSRLDLVSCRNLLIYLAPEAQAKIISLFHFALREGGILLLGSSETVGDAEGRFEAIAKSERLYRHVVRARPGDAGFSLTGDGSRIHARPGPGRALSRQAALGDLGRRLVMEAYAPAAVLSTTGTNVSIRWDRQTAICAWRRVIRRMICWHSPARGCAANLRRLSNKPSNRTRALSSPVAGRTATATRLPSTSTCAP